MKIIKKRNGEAPETVITFEYMQWNDELEQIVGYIEGRKANIQGYDEDKEMHNIRLDKVLYFEAVGELVFAYTQNGVYEIKMRLYQVEEIVGKSRIYRASKSILINVPRIKSIRSALNGRLYAKMENGEELLISRSYAKDIVNYIKSA